MSNRRYYIKLKAYDGKYRKQIINIHNLVAVAIMSLAGDEIAKVLYENGNVYTYDSVKNRRIMYFYHDISLYTKKEFLKSNYIQIKEKKND